MEEFKKPSRPFNVPENKPFYAIDIPNFNWKLWMIITNINDMPIDIREKGPFIKRMIIFMHYYHQKKSEYT